MLSTQFKALTGFSPLSWQSRLFSEYFSKGEVPAAVDIPTGLGKTAVMVLWLTWVLGFGPQVQVRAPAHLARAVQDAAWRLLSRYERLPKRRTRARVSGARKRTGGGN